MMLSAVLSLVGVLTDVLLPLALAILGIAGTIIVTVLQLGARRAEIEDDRREHREAEEVRRRESILSGVLESIGPFSAASSSDAARIREATFPTVVAAAKVNALIRVNGGEDRERLARWWSNRYMQFGMALAPTAGIIENAIVQEITGWYAGRFTAEQIARWSNTNPIPKPYLPVK